jgi:hypothetical protein
MRLGRCGGVGRLGISKEKMKLPIRFAFWCCLVSLLAFPASGNAAWFTNQGGRGGGNVCETNNGWGPATFSTMTAGQAYPIESDNACGSSKNTGSKDTSNWNYLVTGNVTIKNTTDSTETLTVMGYNGTSCKASGTWPNEIFSSCYTLPLYSVNIIAQETKIVPFSIVNLSLPDSACDDFFVTVQLSGSGRCIAADYITWEHVNESRQIP